MKRGKENKVLSWYGLQLMCKGREAGLQAEYRIEDDETAGQTQAQSIPTNDVSYDLDYMPGQNRPFSKDPLRIAGLTEVASAVCQTELLGEVPLCSWAGRDSPLPTVSAAR